MMNRKLIPVKDNEGWFRDPNTGALVSINKREYERNSKIREQKTKEREEFENLKSDVQEIKDLLHKLIEKS